MDTRKVSGALDVGFRWVRRQSLFVQPLLSLMIGLAIAIPVAAVLAVGVSLAVYLPLLLVVLILVLTVAIWILRRRSDRHTPRPNAG